MNSEKFIGGSDLFPNKPIFPPPKSPEMQDPSPSWLKSLTESTTSLLSKWFSAEKVASANSVAANLREEIKSFMESIDIQIIVTQQKVFPIFYLNARIISILLDEEVQTKLII
jgi:hypothetical protein